MTVDLDNKLPLKRKRVPGLDGIRGLAAILVVLFHYNNRFAVLYPEYSYSIGNWAFGKHGVQIFFALSGYVIALTLQSGGSLRLFLVSRFIRLQPSLAASACLTFVVLGLADLPGRESSIGTLLANLTLVPRLLGYGFVDGAYWSIEVELFFYVSVGLFCRATRWSPLAFGAVWTAICLIKSMFPDLPFPYPAVRHAPFFLIGIAMQAFDAGPARWKVSGIAVLWGISTAVVAGGLADGLVACCSVVAISIGSSSRFEWLGTTKPFAFLGAISYPLYLVHQNIGYVILRESAESDLSPVVGHGLALLCSMALAFLVHKLVEEPSITLSRRVRQGLTTFGPPMVGKN